jgi:Sap, sulfolipid-1-addressing protein
MWTYVVCLGFAMLIDPVRIGIAAVLMSRRQAMASLLAFWVGGMIAGVTVGVAVLILLHDVALVAIEAAAATINDVRSAVILLTGEHLRITLGVVALVVLAVMLARDRAQVATRVPVAVGGGSSSDALPEPRKPGLASRISTSIHGMLESGFAWPAFVVGVMSTFPPIEGPMALTVIMGSRAPAGTQFIAFMVFILLVLVFIEVPLVSYLAAPQKTQAVMLAMNTWITDHRRQIAETMLAVMGVASLVQGIVSL